MVWLQKIHILPGQDYCIKIRALVEKKKWDHDPWDGIDVLEILNSQISLHPMGLQSKAFFC